MSVREGAFHSSDKSLESYLVGFRESTGQRASWQVRQLKGTKDVTRNRNVGRLFGNVLQKGQRVPDAGSRRAAYSWFIAASTYNIPILPAFARYSVHPIPASVSYPFQSQLKMLIQLGSAVQPIVIMANFQQKL